jgi:hypothetical protein
MKTISNEQVALIEDAANAGLLGNLLPAIIEKDIHVTDALACIASVGSLRHRVVNQQRGRPHHLEIGTSLVFSGGTCLSKAHDLIQRMSEDIDLKVQLEEVPEEYTLGSGRSDRSRLKDLHKAIQQALSETGFIAETSEGLENPLIRDSRRYFCLSLHYKARFTSLIGALRPQIKIELIHRHTRGEITELPLHYLIDRLTGDAPSVCQLACIGVEETLAEKVLSLLRRCAWNWDGHQRGEIDPVLVRHIYDVWCIASRHQHSVSVAASLFPGLVEVDRREFGRQHPEFLCRPKETLARALAAARDSGELESRYNERLVSLVYAKSVPSFEDAFKVFADIATHLLDSLPEDGAR